VFDLWNNQIRSIGIARATGNPPCRTCVEREFPWLEGRRGAAAISLCGRNAVQIAALGGEPTSLARLAEKLQSVGKVSVNPYLLRLEVGVFRITVFADGRAIVAGTDDVAQARVIHSRYIGG
jgi:adenylyltransferase/sulfurtransferase